MDPEDIAKLISEDPDSKIREFVVTTEGPHYGQPSLVIEYPTEEERRLIYSIMNCNITGDERYELKNQAGAFLQSDGPDFMLIEFWTDDPAKHQPFVDWLNEPR
jgi:hypothetical protein